MKKKPVALIIRDGWGLSPQGSAAAEKEGNAPLLAKIPYYDSLLETYPVATLSASGTDVGLPEGQMGNSEVGHLNLGAGRVVYQDFLRINRAIAAGELRKNAVLQKFLAGIRQKGSSLHLMGLLSDGGVHSHQDHLRALLVEAKEAGIEKVRIHCFLDGRDTSPTGGADYLASLEEVVKALGIGKIATVIGRYFAMDRDQRWERTREAYELLFEGQAKEKAYGKRPSEVVREWYAKGKTDEFMPATVFVNTPCPLIGQGDGVLFFNFRSDRTRQLCRAMSEETWGAWDRGPKPGVELVTMTQYDETFDFPLLFFPTRMENILGEVVAKAKKKQLRMAETEKYPHVTFFFNGGREFPFEGEDREMVSSPKVATYDLQPEMSAYGLTERVVARLEEGDYDLLILNFANPDMVGHTGSLPAAIRAVEVVDECLKKVVEKILEKGGCALVTADHGNCEKMFQEDGSPHTAHTTNLVHLIYVGKDAEKVKVENGILADIAPTLLALMEVEPPPEMTGHSLVS